MAYVAPAVGIPGFTCPHCGTYAKLDWASSALDLTGRGAAYHEHMQLHSAKCDYCHDYTIWHGSELLYPNLGAAPPPHADMPTDIKSDYLEAANIAAKSPRGAAALLRLAVQKLTVYLGGAGKNINDDVAALVTKGLPTTVQQALDIVRVTGNNAVHPGQIEIDSPAVAARLFELVNIITEYMISMPSRVAALYAELPADKRAAIDKRDKPA